MYYYYVDNYCHNKSLRSVPFRICLFPHPKKNLRRRWVNCGCDTLTLTFGMTKYRKGPQRTTKDRKGALRAKLQEIDTN